MELRCEKDAVVAKYALDQSSITDPCTKRVILTSKEACPKMTLGTLWHFFSYYYGGFAIVLIVLGLYFLTLGGRYYKATMLLFGEMTFTAASMILMFALVYPKNAPEYVVWLTLVASLGPGYGVGFLV